MSDTQVDIVGWLRTIRSPRAGEAAVEIESLRQQLAECQSECEEEARLNGMGGSREAALMARLAESQARETVLRDALKVVAQNLAWRAFGECRSYGADVPIVGIHEADRIAKAALALPSDSTALDSAIRQAKREALLEAAGEFAKQPTILNVSIDSVLRNLRRMADELKG